MLSTLKKANPYSTFPLDLQGSFEEHKDKLNVFLELEEGEKIGKDQDEKYYKFSNSYGQLAMRYWYGENRQKTVKYLDEDLGDYMSFLDRLIEKIEQDILGVYKNFGSKVKEYNSDLIKGLYVLKETYNNQRFTTADKKNVVAKTLLEKFVSSIGSINRKAKGIDNKIIKKSAGNILLALLS